MADLLDIANRIAGWARDGEQVEAYVARGRDTEIKVFEGDIESLSSAASEGAGIRIISGHRQGFAYAGTLDHDVLAETLEEARDNVGFGSDDEFFGLAEPDGVPPAELDLWREELAAFPTERKVDLALDLERMVRAGDPRIRGVPSAGYYDGTSEGAVVTNTGIAVYDRRTFCYLVALALAGEGDETQTGFGLSIARRAEDLDLAKAANEAVERSTRLLGAKKPASTRLTAVLDPRVSSMMLAILGGTLNGEAVLKGRSLFAGRVGEEVAVPSVTLIDDPTNPDSLGADRFDDEGLATRRTVLVKEGVLQGFLYNTYAARRAATASTASAVRAGFKSGPGIGHRALSFVPGDKTPEEIVAGIDEGVLVQGVSGLHSGVNPISGDFSVGAEGLMIRNGAVAEPVREMTIASTIQRMLKDVVAIGNDVEWQPGGSAGVTVAIGDISMSGA